MTLSCNWTHACEARTRKADCTTGKELRVARCEQKDVLEMVQRRLGADPQTMRIRQKTVRVVRMTGLPLASA